MTWRDTKAYSNHTWLLNEAQELINQCLISQFGRGEITSPYPNGSWLDVIQIFDYTLEYWNENTINQELFDLIIMIKIRNVPAAVAKLALQFIAAYIINTNSIGWWNRDIYRGNLKYVLQKYFPAHKPLNYDYLRYVLNADIVTNKEEITSLTA